MMMAELFRESFNTVSFQEAFSYTRQTRGANDVSSKVIN